MRNRRFNQDDDYEMAIAIKQGEEKTLNDRFQNYWKKHCDNPTYLNERDTFEVLSRYAIDNFTKTEWYNLFIGRLIKYFYEVNLLIPDYRSGNYDIDLKAFNDRILSTILQMPMKYKENEND